MRPVAVVAGAGPGMGAALARRFVQGGFSVALLGRRLAPLEAIAATIPEGAATPVVAELEDPASIAAAFASVRETLGPVSVLLYNAARWREGPAMSADPAGFASDLALGVTGALVAAQQVHADMRQAGRGTILVTGGGFALAPRYGAQVASLVAAKSGVRGLVFALAEALRPDGIHVGTVTIAGTVAPGTAFDPDVIAERFWSMHSEAPGAWSVESVFSGA